MIFFRSIKHKSIISRTSRLLTGLRALTSIGNISKNCIQQFTLSVLLHRMLRRNSLRSHEERSTQSHKENSIFALSKIHIMHPASFASLLEEENLPIRTMQRMFSQMELIRCTQANFSRTGLKDGRTHVQLPKRNLETRGLVVNLILLEKRCRQSKNLLGKCRSDRQEVVRRILWVGTMVR